MGLNDIADGKSGVTAKAAILAAGLSASNASMAQSHEEPKNNPEQVVTTNSQENLSSDELLQESIKKFAGTTTLQKKSFYEQTVRLSNEEIETYIENWKADIAIQTDREAGDPLVIVVDQGKFNRENDNLNNISRTAEKYGNEIDGQFNEALKDTGMDSYIDRKFAIYEGNNALKESMVKNIPENIYVPDIPVPGFDAIRDNIIYKVDAYRDLGTSHAMAPAIGKVEGKFHGVEVPERGSNEDVVFVHANIQSDMVNKIHGPYGEGAWDLENLEVPSFDPKEEIEFTLNHELQHGLSSRHGEYLTDRAHEVVSNVAASIKEFADDDYRQANIDRHILEYAKSELDGAIDHGTSRDMVKILGENDLSEFKGKNAVEIDEKLFENKEQYFNVVEEEVDLLHPETGESLNKKGMMTKIKSHYAPDKKEDLADGELPSFETPMDKLTDSVQEITGERLNMNKISAKKFADLREKGVFNNEVFSDDIRAIVDIIADRAYIETTMQDKREGLDQKEYLIPDTLSATRIAQEAREAAQEKEGIGSITPDIEYTTSIEMSEAEICTYPYDMSEEAQANMTEEEKKIAIAENKIIEVYRDSETLEMLDKSPEDIQREMATISRAAEVEMSGMSQTDEFTAGLDNVQMEGVLDRQASAVDHVIAQSPEQEIGREQGRSLGQEHENDRDRSSGMELSMA